jgi:hypothetical protein
VTAARAPWIVVAGLVLAGADARADRELHAGLDLRTDLRAHAARIPFGMRQDRIDVSLVLDPLGFADGVHDTDLTVEWRAWDSTFAVLGGWRTTAVSLPGGHQWQQLSLVGVTTDLGRWRWLRARFGAEMSILWVKHGADLPTSWIRADRSIVERFHVGMFVRVEYVSPI